MVRFFLQKMAGTTCGFAVFFLALLTQISHAQETKTVIAGPEYNKSGFYRSLWGKHYRQEWITPVAVKIAMLDTLAGGLTPYELGGSRQTRSLKLRDKNNREYVLRSVDKTFSGALPEITKGSFIENIANDQASIAHPYAALAIAPLAEAAKIYHSNPQIFYIPKQKTLGEFNDAIGDHLYLFEQRPDENWETASNFGNAKKIKSTDKTIEKLLKDNDSKVDQLAFARARLFDMFIGDWGRHEDQWRWAEFEDGKTTLYRPIPRDRDQAFTKFDGTVLKTVKKMVAPHLESFDNDIRRVGPFNYPARNLDRHFLNELSLDQWKQTAADLQRLLTDAVIDSAMKKLPPEVYNFSGPAIAATLKSRRNHLSGYAMDYYAILASTVDITGSDDREFFEVKRLNDEATEINIYKITSKGKKKDNPIYSRIFYRKETDEIRLYGIAGEDEYEVTGSVNKGIKIRLIGGNGKDKFTDASHVKGTSEKTDIYDDHNNEFNKTSETALHLSSDPAVHEFKYASYKFNKKGFKPIIFYNSEDKLYVGLSYHYTKNKWRKEPYGTTQYFDVKYSLVQKGFSSTYKGLFRELIGKWDGVFYANYDFVRWTNFFGLGNETPLVTSDRDFNRLRSKTYMASIGLERIFSGKHKVSMDAFFQGISIINDTGRYITKTGYQSLPDVYDNKSFVGANLEYIYQHLNDTVLPTRGISFLASANYTHNIQDQNRDFEKFKAAINLYAPLTKKFGLAFRVGGSTLSGTPEFYQYNSLGGPSTLRGYRKDRFYGNSSFYNQNELRWITNVRSHIFNGRIGFFGLYDIGRVWLKNEQSNTFHYGYGGGIILSPFNKITCNISYATSSEDSDLYLSIFKVF